MEMWDLFDFSLVHWEVIPQQFTTWLGMVFVVAFSSCLDVAAIEMDMGQQLDINHELASVGWSNVMSGLLGGYTGSYIFSQTIFTYRSRTQSRLVGCVVICMEVLIILLPTSIMSFIPRFFFASTLLYIGLDLMEQWLVGVRDKLLFREYIVLWASFIAINWISLELGMLLGIGFAIINFMLGYAEVKVVNRVFRRSLAVRKYTARTLLGQKRDAIVCLELHGYLFFGSSVQILNDAQKAVHIRKNGGSSTTIPSSFLSTQKTHLRTPLALASQISYEVMIECLDGSPAQETDGLPTEFVVMDFSRVTGMDATAARSSFMILQQLCRRHGIIVIFADVLPDIQNLLIRNEIATSADFFRTMDFALEYCENQLLITAVQAMQGTQEAFTETPGEEIDAGVTIQLHRFIGETDDSPYFQGIDLYFTRKVVERGYIFFHVSDVPDSFYILTQGRVSLLMKQDGSTMHEKTLHVLEHVVPGAMFGEVSFFGHQKRLICARAIQSPCVVYEMTRTRYHDMEREAPILWNRLRDATLHSMALGISNTTRIHGCNEAANQE